MYSNPKIQPTTIIIPPTGIAEIIKKIELPKAKNTHITTKIIIATVSVIESKTPKLKKEEV